MNTCCIERQKQKRKQSDKQKPNTKQTKNLHYYLYVICDCLHGKPVPEEVIDS